MKIKYVDINQQKLSPVLDYILFIWSKELWFRKNDWYQIDIQLTIFSIKTHVSPIASEMHCSIFFVIYVMFIYHLPSYLCNVCIPTFQFTQHSIYLLHPYVSLGGRFYRIWSLWTLPGTYSKSRTDEEISKNFEFNNFLLFSQTLIKLLICLLLHDISYVPTSFILSICKSSLLGGMRVCTEKYFCRFRIVWNDTILMRFLLKL